jgi:hypothetical protein
MKQPGDSGAMVTNINGEWVGMVFSMRLDCESAYLTPVQDIMEDIFETTGGELS